LNYTPIFLEQINYNILFFIKQQNLL